MTNTGVKASIVEPGTIKTPLWEKGYADLDHIVEWVPVGERKRYVNSLKGSMEFARKTEQHGIPPEQVAEKVEHALASPRPRIHYLVGMDARMRVLVEANLPKPLRDRLLTALLLRD